MADDTHQQVDDLVADLAAAFAENSQPDPNRLAELADRADELVSTTDLSALFAAIGFGTADEHPELLPEAVATGDPQHVATLRSLLTASKLSTAETDREERVDELQSLVETARGDPSAEAEPTSDATGDEAETTTDATGEQIEAAGTEEETTEVEATEAKSTEAETAETAEEGDDASSPIRELLESQLQETHGIFDQIPDLESLTGGLGEDDKEKTETVDEDESRDDQSTRKSDGTRWRPGGGKQRTTHSTVPGAGRRDIGRRPGRFSTVRGSTVSKQ